jgi:hypothetical protein
MIRLRDHRLLVRSIPLTKPFRFGIGELRELEHAVLACDFDIDGEIVSGYAGENLAPRWFVKDPSLPIEAEVRRLRDAVKHAATAAASLPALATPFDLWLTVHRHVRASGELQPPLLAQLAESFVERAAIDAWCRHRRRSFAEALHDDAFGFRAAEVDGQLATVAPRRRLSATPAPTLSVRHTVGLSDDLRELAAILREAGIRGLKIKLVGDPHADVVRVRDAVDACESGGAAVDRLTVDGNENYASVDALAALFDELRHGPIAARIAWVEQPLKRDVALTDAVRPLLDRPGALPVVIDESDASPTDLPRALELGYAGATHKSCKGVFKSLLHAAVLAAHRERTGRPTVFSGEDLTIVAPWSQAFDLTAAACVGVVDVERNGQHYADGLAGLGPAAGAYAVTSFPSLYRRDGAGVARLVVRHGRVAVPTGPIPPPPLDGFALV